ncbi:hypothetical protein JCM6882_007187 [Rhodosporidiobolus microsporus]
MSWSQSNDAGWGGSAAKQTSTTTIASSDWSTPAPTSPPNRAPVPGLPPSSPTSMSKMAMGSGGNGGFGGQGGGGGGGGGWSGGGARDPAPHQQQQQGGQNSGWGGGGNGGSWGGGGGGGEARRPPRQGGYEQQQRDENGAGGAPSSWSPSGGGGGGGGSAQGWSAPSDSQTAQWAQNQQQQHQQGGYPQQQQETSPNGYGSGAPSRGPPNGGYGGGASEYNVQRGEDDGGGGYGRPPREEGRVYGGAGGPPRRENGGGGGWTGGGGGGQRNGGGYGNGGEQRGGGGGGQAGGGGWGNDNNGGGYGVSPPPQRNIGRAPADHGGAYGLSGYGGGGGGGGGYDRPPRQDRSGGGGGGGYGGGGGGSWGGGGRGYGGSGGGYGGGGGGYGGGDERPMPPSGRIQYAEPLKELEAVDFGTVQLTEFKKDFYHPHASIAARSEDEVAAFRLAKNIVVEGNAPRPVHSWVEAGLPTYLAEYIKGQGFKEPTAIQAQGMPMALSGQDLVAISETGSGKTLAYALPAVLHINAQDPTDAEQGPIALVLSPTRELTTQIYAVLKDIGKTSGIRVACAYGGVPKSGQLADIRTGCDVLVATPGRLLDFISRGDVKLARVTYLVLDEADRMLYMGFEDEVRQLCSVVRPDRQVLMFSATWPREVRDLARQYLKNAVRVRIGADETHAAQQIKQEVTFCKGYGHKVECLVDQIEQVKAAAGKMLIFVNTKRAAIELTERLRQHGYEALSLQGDKLQPERDFALSEFRKGSSPILVATDVAQRGLDVANVTLVLNFDCPQGITDYVHRIGRTGRAGHAGRAMTFLDKKRDPVAMAEDIIKVFDEADQTVPPELLEFARGSYSFGSMDAYPAADPLPSASDAAPISWGSDVAKNKASVPDASASAEPAPSTSSSWGTSATDTAPKSGAASSAGWGAKPVESDRASVGSNDTARPVDTASTATTAGWGATPAAPSTPRPPSPSTHAVEPSSSPPSSPPELHTTSDEKGYDSGHAPSSPEPEPSSPKPTLPSTDLKPLEPVEEVATPVDEKDEPHEPLSSPVIQSSTSLNKSSGLDADEDAWLDALLAQAKSVDSEAADEKSMKGDKVEEENSPNPAAARIEQVEGPKEVAAEA